MIRGLSILKSTATQESNVTAATQGREAATKYIEDKKAGVEHSEDVYVLASDLTDEEYQDFMNNFSAQILKYFDTETETGNSDKEVGVKEFAQGFYVLNSKELIERTEQEGGEYPRGADVAAYRAVNLLAVSLDYDQDNTISVKELSTMLKYADNNDYYHVDAQDAPLGAISKGSFYSTMDYLMSKQLPESSDLKGACEKYLSGAEMTQEELQAVNTFVVQMHYGLQSIEYNSYCREDGLEPGMGYEDVFAMYDDK